MDADPPLARLVFANPTGYLRFFDQAAILAHVISSNSNTNPQSITFYAP